MESMEYKPTEFTDELYHHGIKGMKWGIRRYQNKDGSLTKAGQKRYNKEMGDLKAEKKVLRNKERTLKKMSKLKNAKDEVDELKKEVEDNETVEDKRARLLKSTDAAELYKNKDLLTTAELNERLNRIDTEARLQSKIVEEKVKTGMDVVNDKMRNVSNTLNNATNMFRKVDEAYSAVTSSAIGKTLAKKLGIEPPKKEFDLNDFMKNIKTKTTQEIMDVNKRLTAEEQIRQKMDAKNKSANEAAAKKQTYEEAKKQVNEYNKNLYESNTSTSDSTYRMSGKDVTDNKTYTKKNDASTLRLEQADRYETTGKDVVGEGTSKFKGFSDPPTEDAIWDGQKYVTSLLQIEDKKGK